MDHVFDNGSVKICTIDDHKVYFLVNGHRLPLYQKPMSKDEFVLNISTQDDFKIMNVEDSSSTVDT